AWPDLSPLMDDRARWPEARTGLANRFAAETQAHWTALFDPLDACVAPVARLAPGGPLPTLEDVFGPNP
ncbi:MAG: hypothetical protein AAF968_23825, partial [Pseudomonadota bacterium]